MDSRISIDNIIANNLYICYWLRRNNLYFIIYNTGCPTKHDNVFIYIDFADLCCKDKKEIVRVKYKKTTIFSKGCHSIIGGSPKITAILHNL